MQRKAISVGLPGLSTPPADLEARVAELACMEADPVASSADATLRGDGDENEQRVGAVLFDIANLARRLGIDPELALRWRALALRDDVVAREAASTALHIPDGRAH